MKLYGVGVTTVGLGKNLTIFWGNSQFVIKLRYPKVRVYKYNTESHKPAILLFLGCMSGVLYPDSENLNEY